MVSGVSMDPTSFNELPFEKALEELQSRVKKLETGELSLEDSLKAFEEGVHLIRKCQGHLSQAEQKIQILSKIQGGEPQLEGFDPTRGG